MSASTNVSGTENGDTMHVLTTLLRRKTASCLLCQDTLTNSNTLHATTPHKVSNELSLI